jgi:hypothetical protein
VTLTPRWTIGRKAEECIELEAEARAAHMEEAAATGAYAPLLEMLAVPFTAAVIKQLP